MQNETGIDAVKAQRPAIKQVSVLFTIVVLLFVTIGTRVQRYDLLKGVLITEFVLILGSALVYLKAGKYNIKEVLRLNNPGFIPFILTFFIMAVMLPVILILNIGNLILIKYLFGRILVTQLPSAVNTAGLLVNIAIIGGSAGICEEALFRGVIQRAYESMGWKKGILLTAFLFGLMHMDFQKLLGTFLLGFLIGYLVYKTNSIFIGMFAHFCNNSFAVLIAYAVTKSGKASAASANGEADLSVFTNMPAGQILGVVIVYFIMLVVCISIIIGLVKLLNRVAGRRAAGSRSELDMPQESLSADYKGLIYTVPAVLFILLFYFYEGYKLSFMEVPVLGEVLQFIMGG
jgi:CAAX amino terminal protease family.